MFIDRARIKAVSWERCIFSKNSEEFHVFSNLAGTKMLKFWKYVKYIENQGLDKRQYCFANISASKARIYMNLFSVNFYLVNLSVKFLEDLYTFYRKWLRLQLVCAHLCTDLHEIVFGGQLLSCEHKHKISLWSEISLRRYLQNNTDVILNFQCILHIFTIWASKFWPNLKNTWNSLEFLEAQFQNVRISLEKVHLSQLTACILA